MTWYYRVSPAPAGTHHGTVVRGRLLTVCGAIYQASATEVLDGAPGDPEQMCPRCQRSLSAAIPLADPDDPRLGDQGRYVGRGDGMPRVRVRHPGGLAVAILIGVAVLLAVALVVVVLAVALGGRP